MWQQSSIIICDQINIKHENDVRDNKKRAFLFLISLLFSMRPQNSESIFKDILLSIKLAIPLHLYFPENLFKQSPLKLINIKVKKHQNIFKIVQNASNHLYFPVNIFYVKRSHSVVQKYQAVDYQVPICHLENYIYHEIH